MFKNYILTAFRNILRYKGQAAINISGLAIAIAICLLLFLWIQDELSYDQYHKNKDRIYRVTEKYEAENKIKLSASSPAPLGPALVNEYPDIKRFVRLARNEYIVTYEAKQFREKIVFADPDIFNIFTIPLVTGNPDLALNDKNSILISEEMNKKYFNNDNPLGKTLTLKSGEEFRITGVFKNIPQNSHFEFDFLASFLYYRPDYLTQWGVSNFWTYIFVSKGFSIEKYNKKIPQFVEKYRGKENLEKYKIAFPLQPLTSIHLHSQLRNEFKPNQEIETVYIFSVVALFILLIACLNYINLASALFSKRAKEVGLRKILGATSKQLIGQFLGESILLTFISIPFALLLSRLFLPTFNELSGKTLTIDLFGNFSFLIVIVGIILVVGVVSGIIPALYISAFSPIAALKKFLKTSSLIPVLRRGLVVFQFSISILFIVCTLIMSSQLQYMKSKEIGLNKENIITVHFQNDEQAQQKYDLIKQTFSQHPDIIAVSASDFFPGNTRWYINYLHEDMENNNSPSIRCVPVDYDFFKTVRVNVIAGRGFSRNYPTDKETAIILNEAAVKEFGWKPDSAIGKRFNLGNGWKVGNIVGVVKDFNYNSLHHTVYPLAICIYPEGFEFISVRYSPGQISHVLEFLEKKWKELVPEQVFVYTFLDEDFNKLYKTETRLNTIFTIISILALFISCFGLLGLVSFTAGQRTKEVGIRKVMGASVAQIIKLLSGELLRWVLVANVIAWPIAWFAMNRWLQNFAFQTTIQMWMFLLAGFIVLFIAMLVLCYKIIRAALANPINSLRYE